MYRLNANKLMTPTLISRYIERNRAEVARRERLMRYYLGKSDILQKEYNDPTKVCNKIISPFANYITDVGTSYFIGSPVQYRSANVDFEEAYRGVCDYNDEAAENLNLAKYASICGSSYELIWLDDDNNLRFKALDPIRAIPIYDDTLEEELIYFIRYYEDEDIESGNVTTKIEVYSRDSIAYYEQVAGLITLVKTEPHNFHSVPIVIYKNNEEEQGDFETVLSLIDAYDQTLSGEIDDEQYFTDAYLVIQGAMATEADDIAKMKENRVLLLDNDAKAEWLIKNVNDNHQNNIKINIAENIHKFAGVPAMTDENFAGTISGQALKFKLLGLENKTAKKEATFKKGIQRRIEIICEYLYLLGTSYDWREIEIIFTRNLPADITATADLITKVGHLLSEETQMSMLNLDIDYAAEQERKEKERAAGYDDFGKLGESVWATGRIEL